MSIRVEDCLRKITLPKRYFNDKFDIAEKFREEAEEYLKLLKLIDGSEFEPDKADMIRNGIEDVTDEIQKNINAIINIFAYHEEANPKAAQEEIDAMMKRMKNDVFIVSIDDWLKLNTKGKSIYTQLRLTPGSRFYRVRAVNEETASIQNNPDELFHIPLSKKAFVNNERFSLAGFPSLYLSSMLPLAWQECGYPKKYYYSEYQYEKLNSSRGNRAREDELKFLGLYSPDEIYDWGTAVKYNHFGLWLEVVMRYLKQYPLVLACSFVNQSGKVTYKQEYIIPQLLMQWVQRNNDAVQGIAYFTCSDLTMLNSRWCAYNIVIPATGPYDDKKYSKRLREAFGWSQPKYYEVPLVDSTHNRIDREHLYTFIEQIREDMREIYFSHQYVDYLLEVLELCCCLYNILEASDTIDMQLALHVMELINKSYSQLNKEKADSIIKEVNEKKDSVSGLEKIDFDKADVAFRNIVQEFTSEDRSRKGIKYIIEKYRRTIWNDFGDGSRIAILYTEKDDLEEAIEWLHDHHCLYFLRKLEADDETIKYIKGICKEAGFELDQLWGMQVGDDEWLKQNMEKIKSPVFVRANDVSINSPDNAKMYDYIQVGFDGGELKEKLKEGSDPIKKL